MPALLELPKRGHSRAYPEIHSANLAKHMPPMDSENSPSTVALSKWRRLAPHAVNSVALMLPPRVAGRCGDHARNPRTPRP